MQPAPGSRPLATLALALGVLAAVGLASGCAKEASEQTFTLDAPVVMEPGGPKGPAVDVENFRGRVTLRVDAEADAVTVVATTEADGGIEDEELPAVADAVVVTAEAEERGGLPVIVVRSTSARAEADHRVDIEIRMPECSGVRIRNSGGVVKVVGVAGAVQVDNTDGPIEVRTQHVLGAPLALTTTAGEVRCLVPPGSKGDITLESDDGKVAFDGPGVTGIRKMKGTPGRFAAVIDGADNPVLLRTGSGFVLFRVVENPETYTVTWR